ncbi:MAG: hypothetical protein ACI9G9_000679 [Psychromonas sp.]|jgi:hypothetical protein
MKKIQLFADSGGSKTDWILMSSDHIIKEFTTASFKPNCLDSQLLVSLKENLSYEFDQINLTFFGSGCHNPAGKKTTADFFKDFKAVNIYSDAEGAVFATIGDNDGFSVILGSGSVFITQKNQKISFLGGEGPVKGDFGSGHYASVLVLDSLFNNKFENKIIRVFCEKNEITPFNYKSAEKVTALLEMSRILVSPIFKEFHQKNIDLFLNKWVVPNTEKGDILHFVGGYANGNSKLLKEGVSLAERSLGQVLDRPLLQTIKYIQTK